MCAIWSTLLPVLGSLGRYKGSSAKWSEDLKCTEQCIVSQNLNLWFTLM